jgi:hypothetical protein
MDESTVQIKLIRKAVMDLRQTFLNEINGILSRLDRLDPSPENSATSGPRPAAYYTEQSRLRKARETGKN